MLQFTTRKQRATSIHFVIIFICIAFVLCSCCCVSAKEIKVTKDWQVIRENETIPAGVHVRMDMTTGEKWVKLVDDSDSNEKRVTVNVQTNGDLAIMEHQQDVPTKKKEPDFDFDMMHRTLSKLPQDEQERMGGLPELPGSRPVGDKVKTPEYRAMFEKRMKEIWNQRQAELRAFEQEFLVDLPDLLKERIRRLQAYLDDPYADLVSMDIQQEQQATADVESTEETHVTDIISVLQDLEYHLADVDMTRDFHTMGGWPLLIAMVDADAHYENGSIPIDLVANVRQVQLNAAWAIGTAIKNTGEFYPYAIEEVQVRGETTTALKVLLKQFQAEGNNNQLMQQKVIYAMSALLRGNRPAQAYFIQLDGPAVLSQNLIRLDPKLIKRLLTLVDDIVADVMLHKSDNELMDLKVANAFSHPIFCHLCLDGLKDEYLLETAMKTLTTIAGTCHWENRSLVAGSIDEAEERWKSLVSSSDLLDELVEMAHETKKVIMEL